ncbi:MAG: transposase [Nanoarchaeota archaeon]
MKERCKLNINPLVLLIECLIICGRNATYKAKDFAYRLIESALENQSLEAKYQLTKMLSADRVLEKLHTIKYEQIQNLVINVNRKLKLPKRVTLAIDWTDKIFYGSKKYADVIGTKGGKYARRFFEVSVVKPALFINAFPATMFTNNKVKQIAQLIDGFKAMYKKTKIELLLVDRGFFAKKVVKYLVENKIRFIMPAKKIGQIKWIAEACMLEKNSITLDYMFGETKVYLVFIKIDDEVLVYMTNTKFNPLKVHLLYKKRWQIETNFREQNKFEFKTQTLDFNARYFDFILAGLLFNLWQLTRKGKVQSYLFKQALMNELKSLLCKIIRLEDYEPVA